jgi:hypothetical protein
MSALLLVPAMLAPAHAQKKQKNPAFCFMGDCTNNDRTEKFQPTSAGLIYSMAKRPEFMDLNYLQYFIGRPENYDLMHGRIQKAYHWYDGHRRLEYELQTTEVGGQVTESTFTAHVPRHDLTFSSVEKLFGQDCKHFFDSEAHPTKLYSLSQNTFLTFSSAPHSHRVTRARVLYKGPGLGRATPGDILQAQQQLKMRTDPIAMGTDYASAIPILRARLQSNPTDSETHFLLARALAKTNHLNEALTEYKYVLATAPNEEMRQRCEEALRQFHVVRPNQPDEQRRTVMTHNGQRIVARGRDDDKATDPGLGTTPNQGINY